MLKFYNILISKILNEIIPATKISISKGNKIFGAAILKKSDYSLVCVGTNNEIINPLFHGEISTLIKLMKNWVGNPVPVKIAGFIFKNRGFVAGYLFNILQTQMSITYI